MMGPDLEPIWPLPQIEVTIEVTMRTCSNPSSAVIVHPDQLLRAVTISGASRAHPPLTIITAEIAPPGLYY